MRNRWRDGLRWLAPVAAGLALASPLAVLARAEPPPGGLSAEAMAEDIATYESRILARDRSFSADAMREAKSRLAALRARVSTLTPAQFELELARILALADNGHTGAAAGSRSRRYNRVGVRLVPFGADFRVLRVTRGNEDLLGASLVGIDNARLSRLRAESRLLSGGTPARRDRFSGFLFESPDLLCASGLARRCDRATYRFRTLDGRMISRDFIAEPPDTVRSTAGSSRWLMPERGPEESGRWVSAIPDARAPWSVQAPAEPFRWREAPEMDALMITLRQTNSTQTASISEFLDRVEAELRQRRPGNLIIDLRFNPGGDLTTTREFMQRAPNLVTGRVFILTSPWTFSAAISSVGYAKQAGGDRVVIVGEAAGDRLEFFAEGGPIPLARSQAVFQFAWQRHDYRTGCRGKPDCYRVVVEHPISIRSLEPDIPAPWRIADYMAGRDSAMEAIRRSIGGPRRP